MPEKPEAPPLLILENPCWGTLKKASFSPEEAEEAHWDKTAMAPRVMSTDDMTLHASRRN